MAWGIGRTQPMVNLALDASTEQQNHSNQCRRDKHGFNCPGSAGSAEQGRDPDCSSGRQAMHTSVIGPMQDHAGTEKADASNKALHHAALSIGGMEVSRTRQVARNQHNQRRAEGYERVCA